MYSIRSLENLQNGLIKFVNYNWKFANYLLHLHIDSKIKIWNMDDDNVAIRLKGFIDSQGLSHSQFADRCGIPRPSLSQILSGRNKKVSDVIIGQIHKAFPSLSVLWLLFGEGEMLSPGSSGDHLRSIGDSPVVSDSLFDDFSESELSFAGLDFDPASNSGSPASRSVRKEPKIMTDGAELKKYQNVTALNAHGVGVQFADKQLSEAEDRISELQSQIEKMRKNPRKVSHITVYYDDSTFETFYPKS